MEANYELIKDAIALLYKVDQERKDFQDFEDDFQEALQNLDYIAEELRIEIVRKRTRKGVKNE